MVEPDDRFGREFCPRSGRPPYFDESFSRRHQGGLGWLSGAPTTPGQHGHLGAPLSDLRRRATGGTASALGLDLLEAAVAAQNDDGYQDIWPSTGPYSTTTVCSSLAVCLKINPRTFKTIQHPRTAWALRRRAHTLETNGLGSFCGIPAERK